MGSEQKFGKLFAKMPICFFLANGIDGRVVKKFSTGNCLVAQCTECVSKIEERSKSARNCVKTGN